MAHLNRIFNVFSNNIRHSGWLMPQSIRCATHKAASSSKNKKGRTPGKRRGWKKIDGDYVEKGMILYRQLGLQCYPGENVGLGRDLTLFALEPGRVFVTSEKLSPHPKSPLYFSVKAGKNVCKQFYHVIPDPIIGKFRLISQT